MQVVISAAVAAVQCGAILPHHGLGFGYGHGYGVHAIPAVAKSTIKYTTADFEKVDAATPADAIKIELVETEHEQDVYTPTFSYATHGYPYGLVHAAAPVVEVKEVEPVELPALHLGGYGYGLGHGLGLGYGYPYGLIHAAAPEVEVKEVELPKIDTAAIHFGGYGGYGLHGGLGGYGGYGGLGYYGGLLGFPHALPVAAANEE